MGVWRISDGQVQLRGLFYDALLVREGIKAGLAVIAAHAAAPYAAEGHPAGGQMNDGVVDAAAAEGDPAEKELLYPFVLGEQVQGQRVGAGVDKV